MKAKPHRTFTITREYLENLGACASGLEAVLPLLPAKISTLPDENYDLACELVEADGSAGDLTWWLCLEVCGRDKAADTLTDIAACVAARDRRDPMVIAQRLAIVADHELSKVGK